MARLLISPIGRGFLRGLGRGLTWLAATALLILDGSFYALLGLRGRISGGDVLGTVVLLCGVGAVVYLAWRKPKISGSLLVALGAFLGFGALVGSATYEGEAHGLLFDEDTFYVFSLGLVPFLSGLLWLFFEVSPKRPKGDS